MKPQIFVNLPVKDLNASMKFYEALGFKNNPQFTDATAAAMVLSDEIYVMLLTHEKFKQFTPLEIADAKKSTQVLNALSFESREKVNEIFSTAIKAGGSQFRPEEDHGFMFAKSFADPDGHVWEPFFMNPDFIQK